jgi:RNA polymerase subunit RPABC4/transcription elongation factor Spt4/flagellar motor protein MotB
MECGSCSELIPDDSIFCPECGARQDMSRAGSFTSPNSIGLSGQEVSGGRNFGVVSGEAIRHQRDMGATDLNSISPELLQQIAQGLQNQQNIPPGSFPPQNIQSNVIPNSNQINQIPQNKQNLGNMQRNVNPNQNIMNNQQSNNVQTNSPTDQMVNRLAEAEKAMKTERRSQWLNMNQTSASNVLSSLGADLPPHLRGEDNAAKDILSGALGTQNEAPNDAFLRRMCEVAVRRVARKRGVAVETPQAKLDGDILSVNITYVDDGRVLDTPEDLKQAFEHAIQTEVALKGFDYLAEINLFRSKDGEVEDLSGESSDDEEEMFACEICEGLVKESDNSCPHCGAVFEEEDEEPAPRSPPRGPGRSSPPGPSRSPPRGPQRGPPGGPSRSNPPGGPKRSGPPGGPKRSGPPGGPNSGPPKGGPSGGPSVGPKRGGPPGGPSKGGPPKGPKRGPPR